MKEPETLQAETQVVQIPDVETQDLQSIFYELVQKNQGSMTVMQLAIAAGITGEDSKAYLEQQVKQFQADFEVTETGTLVYKFPV
ncbi:MAG: hypothetical protein SWJ54_06965 [Cyanobacteriota bacterium]|nr:hypothetical protein [Cyanobacteriota bacterium]